MFVVLAAEVDEGRVEIQSVTGDRVEETPIVGHDPFEQSLGGGFFSFARP
jgi:hypothetical protein